MWVPERCVMLNSGRFESTPPSAVDAVTEIAVFLGILKLRSTLPVPVETVMEAFVPFGRRWSDRRSMLPVPVSALRLLMLATVSVASMLPVPVERETLPKASVRADAIVMLPVLAEASMLTRDPRPRVTVILDALGLAFRDRTPLRVRFYTSCLGPV